ncbi:MAG: circularly permuted type 2 ATP-grasp protein [Cyanobacteriota bacterium]|nr:circularly permuted type 2 ATP-grasp protein [Cyanobacteriota bacterium]
MLPSVGSLPYQRFDPLPRLIDVAEWRQLAAGLCQRIRALDAFVADVYGRQLIIRDGLLPEALLMSSPLWRRDLLGCTPSLGRWCALAGFDVIRTSPGRWLVLEDNLRRASGIGYALLARQSTCEHLGWLLDHQQIAPIDVGPALLLNSLRQLAPWNDNPHVVVLTSGRAAAAFFEHRLLADAMGVPVLEPSEIYCEAGRVWRYSEGGREQVDVIYRRNDDFYAASVGCHDLWLGVPGLMEVYASGGVAIVNPPGVGIGADKLLYRYVPFMVSYYLDERPLLDNVPTVACGDLPHQQALLKNLEQWVVKPVAGAGGAGMLIGPRATDDERLKLGHELRAHPRNFIAQPFQHLSRGPTLIEGQVNSCIMDLRPFVIYGSEPIVIPGPLTRVARDPESMVVNLSQGGVYKDTWLADVPRC